MNVAWPSLTNGSFERLVALLLHQTRPKSWRRKASRGDSGIDFLNPRDQGYEVFQIKFFPGPLTASRKRKIAESLETFKANIDRQITSWSLVLPENRTKEAEAWFAELTSAYEFPCEWLGETALDDLAKDHPAVIEYMLGDGRERLERLLKDWKEVLESPGPVTPGSIYPHLDELTKAINRADPHYWYGLSTWPSRPPDSSFAGCVMTQSLVAEDGSELTIAMFPRYPQAVEDRPVTFRGVLAVAGERATALQEVFEFGASIELGEDELPEFTVNAPGGLGYSGPGLMMRIGPADQPDRTGYRLRVGVIGPEGDLKVALPFDMVPAVSGTRGQSIEGTYASGLLQLQARIFDNSMNVHMALGEVVGGPVDDVLGALRFMSYARVPFRLVVGGAHGAMFLEDAMPFPAGIEPIPSALLKLVEDLSELQKLTPLTIALPGRTTATERAMIRKLATLARGNVVTGTWTEVAGTVKPRVAEASFLDGGTMLLALEQNFEEVVNGVPIKVGQCSVHFGPVRLAQPVPDNLRELDDVRVTFVPENDGRYSIYPHGLGVQPIPQGT